MTPAAMLEYTATALVLAGVWLIGNLSVRGQWLMLLAQVVWGAVAVQKGMWGLAAQSAVLLAFTWRSIFMWRRDLGRWW